MADYEQDSVEELVKEGELVDLLDYEHMQGMTGREILYEEDSTNRWMSAEYSLNLRNWR